MCLLAYANAIFVVPVKAQSHYGCDSLGAIWGMGMLSSCICSTLVSVYAMKYSHRAIGSVRKGLDIPHSFVLSSKLR